MRFFKKNNQKKNFISKLTGIQRQNETGRNLQKKRQETR